MESFKDFHDKYKELSEEKLQEFIINQGTKFPLTQPPKNKPLNQQPQHKEILKLWNKFLKDITRIGYISPSSRVTDKITLHKRDFQNADVRGNFQLDLPTGFRRK